MAETETVIPVASGEFNVDFMIRDCQRAAASIADDKNDIIRRKSCFIAAPPVSGKSSV